MVLSSVEFILFHTDLCVCLCVCVCVCVYEMIGGKGGILFYAQHCLYKGGREMIYLIRALAWGILMLKMSIFTHMARQLAQKLVGHTHVHTHNSCMHKPPTHTRTWSHTLWGVPTTHTCTNHKLTHIQTTNASHTHTRTQE